MPHPLKNTEAVPTILLGPSLARLQFGLAMTALQRIFKNTDLLLGLGMLALVAMLVLPMPEWLLDVGLVLSLATSVVIMLTAVNVKEPLHFSVFPSLLVVTTLLRLSLSMAAAKLILSTGSAGHVIQTFGEFVLGGNFVVGFVTFIILMIVQFVVITNGSTRVSEVVARFTLDAMPGKQMAIDSDLAAGLIDEEQARDRRKAVKQEADFYGAMDGASKFVKGDAIASILIIIVNIIGGFAMGFMRGEGDVMTILSTYAILSVGEGLVSQIPSLLISTSSGLLVTRNGQETGMGGTMFGQLLGQSKVMQTASLAMVGFAFVPGFPTVIFLGFGGLLFALSRFADKNPATMAQMRGEAPPKAAAATAMEAGPAAPAGPEAILPLVAVDQVEFEIGYSLTRLADTRVGGDLADRVAATRKQIAMELGYVMPSVRIRDNAGLRPTEYVIKIRGEKVAGGDAEPGGFLAIDGGGVIMPVPGTPTKEPVFGLDALWISADQREAAERAGYTVVEPTAMMSTHLAEIIKTFAAELLSRQEVNALLEQVKKTDPAAMQDLEPAGIGIGEVQKVLQHLLRERVPIRDLVTILETLADYGGRVKETDSLGELVRANIGRTLTRQYVDAENRLFCLTLEPSLEQKLQEAIQHTAGGVVLAVDPSTASGVAAEMRTALENAAAQGTSPVLLCSTQMRLPLRRLMERQGVQVAVLAYNEVSAQAEVEFAGVINLPGQESAVGAA